ncbi:hypothetical protein RB614_25880 [Phytohabitans sp. ZYX-F-186]|uniref:Uncharacterized protein n=1 Tax=Phytohabitans maris TaxID=3071409 RepID=A0ABU0ZLS4_9ACTN|nr:hypothetical protein [Phytohabitans sp. ZYX-F-186]MDQ7907960.1 hypothetical protein [Phytohabitans sp. ZYX-F-186]
MDPVQPEPSIRQVAAATAEGSSVIRVGRDDNVGTWLVSSREIDQEEIDRVRLSFAEPDGFTQVRAVLQRYSLVIIRGKEDVGRRSTALRLLDEVASGGIREFLTDWPSPRTDLLPHIDRPCLLDLTFETDVIPEGFGRQLADLVRPMYETGGCLIVTVTPALWTRCAQETKRFTVDLQMPDPVEVVRAHLKAHDAGGERLTWLGVPPLSEFMGELRRCRTSPRDAVALAARLSEFDEHTSEMVKDLRRQLYHWKDYLDKRLGGVGADRSDRHTVARRRAVLVAAAVLDGSPAEAVLASSDAFLTKIGIKVPPDEFLVGPELSGMLEDIEEDRADKKAGTVSIIKVKPGVDDAILGRIWQERPQLHGYLLEWLAEIAADRSQPSSTLPRVAEVLARLAEQQRALAVLDIMQSWLAASADVTKHRLAVDVLERLAVSRDIGSVVRRRLREWALSRRAEDGVLIGVAEVCAGRLGRYSTDVALNRLQLIAQSRRGVEVDQAVVRAIRGVAEHDGKRRLVLDRILAWSFEEETRAAGMLGLSALTGPTGERGSGRDHLLDAAEFPMLRKALASAWSVLLGSSETRASAFDLAEVWLRRADDELASPDLVVAILGPAFLKVSNDAIEVATFLFAPVRQSKTREKLGLWLLRVDASGPDVDPLQDESAGR